MTTPSCLAIARLRLNGSLENNERKTGVPRSVQQRAEVGLRVSKKTREKIEAAFHARLEDLQRPFLGELG
jgi:hypothetical protein